MPRNSNPLEPVKKKNILSSEGVNRLAHTKYGYMLYNDNDMYIGRSLREYGEFSELEVELLLKFCRPGSVVIEVGANVGTHSLAIAKTVGPTGRVYAYEPQPAVFQMLCANMALNDIRHVECRNQAVGSEAGTLNIPNLSYDQEGNFGGISMDHFDREFEGVWTTKVEMVALDEVLDPPRLNLMKIDVEGMEIEVIRGAKGLIGKHRPAIYCENDKKDKSPILLRELFKLGYRAWWHLPRLFNPRNFFGKEENVFGNVVSGNILCVHESAKFEIKDAEPISDPDAHPLFRE